VDSYFTVYRKDLCICNPAQNTNDLSVSQAITVFEHWFEKSIGVSEQNEVHLKVVFTSWNDQ